MIKIVGADEARYIFEKRNQGREKDLEGKVSEIISRVRSEGDAALCGLSLELDGVTLTDDNIRVPEEEIQQARETVGRDFLKAVKEAVGNIREYHQKQLLNSWIDFSREGVLLGQVIRPLDRVGIYVPGGKASYPSSVLMNAIPAMVAGVREIAMVTPPSGDGRVNIHTLAAAAEAGVTEVYRIGGAQAVAALAYGTKTIRRVDKITGPGNKYVTMAKKLVFGAVDIDMLAGPSEVLVVADSSANPAYIAADLLSQAEHDEMASVVLVTPDRGLADAVAKEVEKQVKGLGRTGIAARAVKDYGAIIVTASLEEAVVLANSFAPEHLELAVNDPYNWLPRITAAGAVFMGHYTPEPVGDYIAGPNHILPTGGTARFFSPLGVDQFLKRISVISYSRAALEREAGSIIKLAGVEGLDAHAKSVQIRLEQPSGPQSESMEKTGRGSLKQKSPGGSEKERAKEEIDAELKLPTGLPGFVNAGGSEDTGKMPGIPGLSGGESHK
ncbi:MAG: histidinol dehydrogenase [Bacillota bacterium]